MSQRRYTSGITQEQYQKTAARHQCLQRNFDQLKPKLDYLIRNPGPPHDASNISSCIEQLAQPIIRFRDYVIKECYASQSTGIGLCQQTVERLRKLITPTLPKK